MNAVPQLCSNVRAHIEGACRHHSAVPVEQQKVCFGGMLACWHIIEEPEKKFFCFSPE